MWKWYLIGCTKQTKKSIWRPRIKRSVCSNKNKPVTSRRSLVTSLGLGWRFWSFAYFYRIFCNFRIYDRVRNVFKLVRNLLYPETTLYITWTEMLAETSGRNTLVYLVGLSPSASLLMSPLFCCGPAVHRDILYCCNSPAEVKGRLPFWV